MSLQSAVFVNSFVKFSLALVSIKNMDLHYTEKIHKC